MCLVIIFLCVLRLYMHRSYDSWYFCYLLVTWFFNNILILFFTLLAFISMVCISFPASIYSIQIFVSGLFWWMYGQCSPLKHSAGLSQYLHLLLCLRLHPWMEQCPPAGAAGTQAGGGCRSTWYPAYSSP